MNHTNYIDTYLEEAAEIIRRINRDEIRRMIELLENLRRNSGRLFILGVGGSAANASHAVNDFRKICNIETYTPVDNVGELTAWTNDKGFEHVFSEWLKGSRLGEKDAILVFSVGGGSETTSKNLILAIEHARTVGAKVLGVVSRDGGVTKKMADICILIPVVSDERITPHAESWQGVIWHLIVNALP